MLKYVGDGASFFNIPARDVTEQEVKEIEARFGFVKLRDFLLNSGLYTEAHESKPEEES